MNGESEGIKAILVTRRGILCVDNGGDGLRCQVQCRLCKDVYYSIMSLSLLKYHRLEYKLNLISPGN